MEFLEKILQYIVTGGATSIIVILCIIIVALAWDRLSLVKSIASTTKRAFDAKDDETKFIREITDRYHQGNLDLVQALNEIKMVLMTLQNTNRH